LQLARHVVRFVESSWNYELNVMDYPVTASYRQRVTPPTERARSVETESEELGEENSEK